MHIKGAENPLQAQTTSRRAGSPSAVMQGQGGGGEVQVPSGRRMWLRSEAKLGRNSSPGTTLYILQQARDHQGQHGIHVIPPVAV